MNIEVVTLQDCVDMRKMKNQSVVINDGKIMGFIYEKSTEPDNQSDQC